MKQHTGMLKTGFTACVAGVTLAAGAYALYCTAESEYRAAERELAQTRDALEEKLREEKRSAYREVTEDSLSSLRREIDLAEIENSRRTEALETLKEKNRQVRSDLEEQIQALESDIADIQEHIARRDTQNALYAAATSGDVEGIRRSISAGANINAPTAANDRTALHWAAQKGHLSCVEALLELGAARYMRDASGLTPLMTAVKEGHLSVCAKLIEAGDDINTVHDETGKTLVHIAVGNHNLEIMRYLIQHNADINAKDKAGDTPISLAAEQGLTDVYEVLKDAGAYLSFRNRKGQLPGEVLKAKLDAELYQAASANKVQECREAIRKGANVNAPQYTGKTPLHAAARNGCLSSVEYLLDAGADVNARDESGQTPLYLAVQNYYSAVCKTLLRSGANPNIANSVNGRTPLHAAATMTSDILYQMLLAAGARENVRDSEGNTPRDIRNRLFAGAPPTEDSTPPSYQAYTPAAPAPPAPPRNQWDQPSAKASRSGMTGVINLVRHAYCPDATTQLYQKRLMTLLPRIQEGESVDLTLPETKGNTALHYACGMSNIALVVWLVEHGADVNKRTDAGMTPLQCVGGANGEQIRRYLISKGAR